MHWFDIVTQSLASAVDVSVDSNLISINLYFSVSSDQRVSHHAVYLRVKNTFASAVDAAGDCDIITCRFYKNIGGNPFTFCIPLSLIKIQSVFGRVIIRIRWSVCFLQHRGSDWTHFSAAVDAAYLDFSDFD